MNKFITAVVATCVAGSCWFGAAHAQQGPKGGAGTPGTGRMYDPKTVETVSGEVVSMDPVTSARGTGYGVHLTLKTDKETISIHLGPGWYIDAQKIKIAPKDAITVKGSRITFEGKPAIIAAEITKGEQVLKLRNESGIPAWAGGRGRTAP